MSRRRNNKQGNKPNTGKGNRPNKPNTKGKDANSTSSAVESPSNDPKWYAQNAAMLRDSAAYPFNEAIGTPVVLDDHILDSVGGIQQYAIPGILSMMFIPTAGYADAETDALNVAARKLFNTLRAYNNSGNPPYDPNDLMQIEIAIANAYAYVNMCARAYGILNLFVYKNRYLPEGLFQACNLDYSDFRDHMAQFRWDLDYMIASLASLWAPGNIPYFAQCSQMYAGYYVEGDDVKDQLYITVPYYFYQYEEASATYPGGRLRHFQWFGQGSGTNGLHTRADLLSYFQQLVAPLMNNTDVNLISGDVRKAFGENIIKIGDIGLNYQILPSADLTMLEKFKNAKIMTRIADGEIVPDATQGFLKSTPHITGAGTTSLITPNDYYNAYGSVAYGGTKLLTTIRTAPSDADVMEMTRWTAMIDPNSIQNVAQTGYKYDAHMLCGSYVPVGFHIWEADTINGGYTANYYTDIQMVTGSTVTQDWAKLSNFKFHPEVRFYYDDGQVAGFEGSSYDIDNYTIVTSHDIDRMNDAALFSLFNA